MKNFNVPYAWYPTKADRELADRFDVKRELAKALKEREIYDTVEVIKELMKKR